MNYLFNTQLPRISIWIKVLKKFFPCLHSSDFMTSFNLQKLKETNPRMTEFESRSSLLGTRRRAARDGREISFVSWGKARSHVRPSLVFQWSFKIFRSTEWYLHSSSLDSVIHYRGRCRRAIRGRGSQKEEMSVLSITALTNPSMRTGSSTSGSTSMLFAPLKYRWQTKRAFLSSLVLFSALFPRTGVILWR